MAKQRIVNTRFWDDSYIARLSPNEKLLFLYLLTSPLTTIAGVYELPLKRAAFDTGLPVKEIAAMFSKLENDGKLVCHEDWVGIVNFIRHQSLNPKVRQGIAIELKRAPKELVERLPVDLAAMRTTGEGGHAPPERWPEPRRGRGVVRLGELLPDLSGAGERAAMRNRPEPQRQQDTMFPWRPPEGAGN